MGRHRDPDKEAGEEFDERKLLASSESSESEHSYQEHESEAESEISGDEAVEKLKQLEAEYRRVMAKNDPLARRAKTKKFKHHAQSRRLLREQNKELQRELDLYQKENTPQKAIEFEALAKSYIKMYNTYKSKVETGINTIRTCRRHYTNAVYDLHLRENQLRKLAQKPLIPIKVHQRRVDHLQDNCYRVQCQLNMTLHENHILMERIREQLVEFSNHIIQRRTIKTHFGAIRLNMFTMVEEANRDFERFYNCLEKVKFLGTENEKQNHEFQNALWDSERFHAFDMELEKFHNTKLIDRPAENSGLRTKRYAVFHTHICNEKIQRYKKELARLAKFPGGRDIGNFAILYKELDLACQGEFTRITELDAEVDAIYPQVLEIQKKLDGVFNIDKAEKQARELEMKKLEAKSETEDIKVNKAEFEVELGEISAENVMDSVQNIFDIASAFEGSVLGLLGTKGNTITPRSLEPALHVLEHRISELIYMKAAYTLRKGAQLQGKPLPVIGVPLKRKGEPASTSKKGKPIGKPKSHGGFFMPKVLVDFGSADIGTTNLDDSEPVSFNQLKYSVEQLDSKFVVNIDDIISSSDTESLEPDQPPPREENEKSTFLQPSRIISTLASVASVPVPPHHSTHEDFYRESVQINAEELVGPHAFRLAGHSRQAILGGEGTASEFGFEGPMSPYTSLPGQTSEGSSFQGSESEPEPSEASRSGTRSRSQDASDPGPPPAPPDD